MSPEDTIIPPENDLPESDLPESDAEFIVFETEIFVADEDLIESELWEALPDRQPAPFIAGTYDADDLQANLAAVAVANAGDLQANLSAVGVAKTEWFESIGSAIGVAFVNGDAEISTSMTPLVITKGDTDFHQAYASALIAGGTVRVHQGGSPLMVAKKLKVKQGGGAVMIAGEAKVKRSFVGILFSRHTEVSENSKVLVSGTGAALISAAVLGGLALVAYALFGGHHDVRGAKRHGR